MITCDDKMLQMYIDGELGELEIKMLAEHLHSCTHCRRELNFWKIMDWELCHRPPADVPQELAVLRARALDACFAGEKVAEGKAFGIPEIFLIQMNVLKYSTSFLRFSRGRIAPPAKLRRKNKKGRFPAKRWLLAGARSLWNKNKKSLFTPALSLLARLSSF
jgi:hypothetical protein